MFNLLQRIAPTPLDGTSLARSLYSVLDPATFYFKIMRGEDGEYRLGRGILPQDANGQFDLTITRVAIPKTRSDQEMLKIVATNKMTAVAIFRDGPLNAPHPRPPPFLSPA